MFLKGLDIFPVSMFCLFLFILELSGYLPEILIKYKNDDSSLEFKRFLSWRL